LERGFYSFLFCAFNSYPNFLETFVFYIYVFENQNPQIDSREKKREQPEKLFGRFEIFKKMERA